MLHGYCSKHLSQTTGLGGIGLAGLTVSSKYSTLITCGYVKGGQVCRGERKHCRKWRVERLRMAGQATDAEDLSKDPRSHEVSPEAVTSGDSSRQRS